MIVSIYPVYLSFNVTVTIYNAESNQCDDTPLITASNDKINENSINWIALSRDLKKNCRFDDTIELFINGRYKKYIVKDLMNKRWTNRVDILIHTKKHFKVTSVLYIKL
jgi:3D (Asp-Asp-Asp) domain-containing protein